MMRDHSRKRLLVGAGLAATLVGLYMVAHVPVTTRQGVNFEVTEHTIPLYVKGIEFLDRHVQYRQLADEITRGVATDEHRLLAVFDWTTRNIRPTPDGWPIVDDHILNIVIRRHGLADQRADVFATLATYAGIPAFWSTVAGSGTTGGLVLSFARLGERWVVVDVANGLVFRTASGALATLEDLAANPALLPEAAQLMTVGSTPYRRVLEGRRTPPIPRPLRSELQMPWPRLRYEAARTVGFEHDHGSQR